MRVKVMFGAVLLAGAAVSSSSGCVLDACGRTLVVCCGGLDVYTKASPLPVAPRPAAPSRAVRDDGHRY